MGRVSPPKTGLEGAEGPLVKPLGAGEEEACGAVCQGAALSDNSLTLKLDQHVTSIIYRQERVMTVNGKLAALLQCKYLLE